MRRASLILMIGGLSVRIKSEDPAFLDDLRVYYANFLGRPPCDVAAQITVEHQTLSFRDDIAVTKENGSYRIDGGEFQGTFSLKSREAGFTMRAQAGLFDSFLRVLYSLLLIRDGGFLVHAAGLERKGQGYLFAGPSEAGKTTTATRADGFTVLNDELTLVKKEGDRFFLHATPFNGDYDRPIRNGSAPLKGLYFLDKELTEGFAVMNKIQSLLKLLECVFFFDPDVTSNQKVLDLCHQLVSSCDGVRINIFSREHLGGFIDEIAEEYSRT